MAGGTSPLLLFMDFETIHGKRPKAKQWISNSTRWPFSAGEGETEKVKWPSCYILDLAISINVVSERTDLSIQDRMRNVVPDLYGTDKFGLQVTKWPLIVFGLFNLDCLTYCTQNWWGMGLCYCAISSWGKGPTECPDGRCSEIEESDRLVSKIDKSISCAFLECITSSHVS